MLSAHHVAWAHMEGERAFGQAIRARRRASLARRALPPLRGLRAPDRPRRAHAPAPQRRDASARSRWTRSPARSRPGRALRLRQRVPAVEAGAQALAARVGRRAHGRRPAADRRRPGRRRLRDPRRPSPRVGRPRPRRGRRSTRSSPRSGVAWRSRRAARSSTSATCAGSSQVGMCPQPAQPELTRGRGDGARPARRAGRARARRA